MRVLLVNKFYWRSAGAEAVVFETQRLLEGAGHEVAIFAMSDVRNEQTPWDEHFARHRQYDGGAAAERARDAIASVYSVSARRGLRSLVRRFRPDVAHLHNVYHQLTLSVVDELRAHRVPMVMTLHDYKIVCPNNRLLTHDGLCTRCVGGDYLNAVVHKCIKDSRAASVIGAAEAYLMRALRQYSKIDLLLSPSKFLADIVVAAGHSSARVRVIPNPVEAQTRPREAPGAARFIYFGRLAQEKGVDVLLRAAATLPSSVGIDIVGTGPSQAALAREAASLPQVRLHGHVAKPELAGLLDAASAAVLPAVWYENCPMSILEAAARGVPSVASRLGGIPELVEDGVDGYLVDPGDVAALTRTLAAIASEPAGAAAVGERAWLRVRSRHSPTGYLAAIEQAYADAQSEADLAPSRMAAAP